MSSQVSGKAASGAVKCTGLLPVAAALFLLLTSGCVSDVSPRPGPAVQATSTLAPVRETPGEATTSTLVEEATSSTAVQATTTEPPTTTLAEAATTSTTLARNGYACGRSSDCGRQESYLKCSNNNVVNFSNVPVCKYARNGSYCANILRSEVKDVCGRGKFCVNESCVYGGAPTAVEASLTTLECVEEAGYDGDGLVYAYASACGDDYLGLMGRASVKRKVSVAFVDIRRLTEKQRELLECFYGEYGPDNPLFLECPRMLCPRNGRILAVNKNEPVYIMEYLPDCQRDVAPTRNVSMIFMRNEATKELVPCVNDSDCGQDKTTTSCIDDAVVKYVDEHLCSQPGREGAVCMVRRVTEAAPCILDEKCRSDGKRVYCART